ncbi:MAG: hypothetical protein LBN43_07010 [Oscillospiraceae bacterium]|jgi:nicotinamide riboside kinase|nr:hypothetical protein [Oscillospiraceae bacterium]
MGLFKPKWLSNNDEKVSKAINEMNSQTKLARVARQARQYWAREQALNKLTDQKILADIAKNGEDAAIRVQAAEKLIDQSLAQKIFADLAKVPSSVDFRLQIVDKITDQSLKQELFADIFRNNDDPNIRSKLLDKLTDKSILTDIAVNFSNDDWRRHACLKLTNGEHIIEGCICTLCGTAYHKFKVIDSSSHNERHINGYDMTITNKTLKCDNCGIITAEKVIDYQGYDSDYNR